MRRIPNGSSAVSAAPEEPWPLYEPWSDPATDTDPYGAAGGTWPELDPTPAYSERSVIGACLMGAEYADKAAGIVTAHDFFDHRHPAIFEAVMKMSAAGIAIGVLAVAQQMRQDGTLSRCGGQAYLHDAWDWTQTTAEHNLVTERATAVAENAAKQRLAESLSSLALKAARPESNTRELRAAIEDISARLVTFGGGTDEHKIGPLVADLVDRLDEPLTAETGGIPWGWADIDNLLLPMQPGQLCVVAAGNGIGKSVWLINVARNVAVTQGRPVVVHSLEMTAASYAERFVAAHARIPLDALLNHTVTDEQKWRAKQARDEVMSSPLTIIDGPDKTLPDFRASVRKHRPELLAVDYLQLVEVAGKRPEDRRLGLDALTRGLKVMSKTEGISVLAAAQLNRDNMKRTDRTPVLSDIREFGGAGNDADVVVLLHREDAYSNESARAGEIDVIVAKQRGGPTGTVALSSQLHYQKFSDLARWGE